METLDPNFADFLKLLNVHGVEYLVVGGYAVGFHGFVRATGDLDVFVGLSERNAEKLVSVFHDFGFDSPELIPALFMEPGQIIRLGVPPLRLEVLNQISGVTFPECYESRIQEAIDGIPISFIDRKRLIQNKRAAGRPKDLADLDALTQDDDGEPAV